MTVEEVKNIVEELKAQGLSDEAIAASFYQMYKEDKIDLDQFDALVKVVGYELSDNFKQMPDDEKKSLDIGSFGMEDEEGEDETPEKEEEVSNDEPSNDEDEEEENPFEKDYDKKPQNDDDDEAEKMYGFKK